MRKMYKDPKMEISKLAPRNIVCVSTEPGGGTDGNKPSGTEGDAPKRRTKVF